MFTALTAGFRHFATRNSGVIRHQSVSRKASAIVASCAGPKAPRGILICFSSIFSEEKRFLTECVFAEPLLLSLRPALDASSPHDDIRTKRRGQPWHPYHSDANPSRLIPNAS